jgi:hypothetical protein
MTGNWASRMMGPFPQPFVVGQPAQPQNKPAQPPVPTMFATGQDIYQAARALAVRDHEIDLLFNADFYGEGI